MVDGAIRLAVLMPAWNPGPEIRSALRSLAASTIPHDVFVADDGSRPPVREAFGALQANVHLVELPANRGVAAARNAGLREILARGYEFVALQDADDDSKADRLQKQMAFLDEHPEVGVVGTWAKLVDMHGNHMFLLAPPVDDAGIRRKMWFNMPIANPTVMFRSEILRQIGLYDETLCTASDYDLIWRASRVTSLANLLEPLVLYRVNPEGLSESRHYEQLRSRLVVQMRYFSPVQWRSWAGVGCTLLAFLLFGRLRGLRSRLRAQRGLPLP